MKKPIEAPSHLNAQQVAALEKDIRAKLDTLVKDVELRKWAAELAVKLSHGRSIGEPSNAVTLASMIYEFASKHVNEPLVTAPSPSA